MGDILDSQAESTEKNQTDAQIDWHSGFCGGLELELRENKADLSIEREHLLSKEPLQMDLLILKMRKDLVIQNEIGAFFRMHNIIEYKGIGDELTIDTLFKVLSYACLYKSEGGSVDDIPVEEITVSIYRYSYPQKLIKALESMHHKVRETAPGIYQIEGLIFPVQLVIIKRLEKDRHRALRILTPNAPEEEIRAFLQDYLKLTEESDLRNARALLHISARANEAMYRQIGEEELSMSDRLMRSIFGEDYDRIIKERDEARNVGRAEGEARGRAAGRAEGEAHGRNRGILETLLSLVHDGLISPEVGAERANMSEADFTKNLQQLYS